MTETPALQQQWRGNCWVGQAANSIQPVLEAGHLAPQLLRHRHCPQPTINRLDRCCSIALLCHRRIESRRTRITTSFVPAHHTYATAPATPQSHRTGQAAAPPLPSVKEEQANAVRRRRSGAAMQQPRPRQPHAASLAASISRSSSRSGRSSGQTSARGGIGVEGTVRVVCVVRRLDAGSCRGGAGGERGQGRGPDRCAWVWGAGAGCGSRPVDALIGWLVRTPRIAAVVIQRSEHIHTPTQQPARLVVERTRNPKVCAACFN
jgi:hypothetical protein